jgi:hypothetical protein
MTSFSHQQMGSSQSRRLHPLQLLICLGSRFGGSTQFIATPGEDHFGSPYSPALTPFVNQTHKSIIKNRNDAGLRRSGFMRCAFPFATPRENTT